MIHFLGYVRRGEGGGLLRTLKTVRWLGVSSTATTAVIGRFDFCWPCRIFMFTSSCFKHSSYRFGMLNEILG